MNSKDDPLVHHSTIPFDVAELNKHIMLLVTQCGKIVKASLLALTYVC